MSFRLLALTAVAAAVVLLMAASASAATVRVSISGSFTTAAVPADNDPATGVSFAGVADNYNFTGTGSGTGTVTLTFPSPPANATGPGASLTEFHGDISQGCIRFQNNRAVVVGHLPASEQYDIPFGHIEYVGTNFEDNGVATGGPVDRARAVTYRTQSGQNRCNPANSIDWNTVINGFNGSGALVTVGAGDASLGYTDQLDAFPNRLDTNVSIVDSAGLPVTVSDATDPKGLQFAVGSGTGNVRLDACGYQVDVAAGSTFNATCMSLDAEVVAGSATVVLGGGLTLVDIPEGGEADISGDESSGFTVHNLGSTDITVTVDGEQTTIGPGETKLVQAWDFQGFSQPVDNPPTLNTVKAGAVIPLKWRLLDASGAPVTDLASATITVTGLSCETSASSDQIEELASFGSGLQNLGDGYYQLNWKTLSGYANTCKAMHLDIGDGVTHDAWFKFSKK